MASVFGWLELGENRQNILAKDRGVLKVSNWFLCKAIFSMIEEFSRAFGGHMN